MFSFTRVPENLEDLPEYLRRVLMEIESSFITPDIYVAEQFMLAESSVNTRWKKEGMSFWDSTSKKPVWAVGNAPKDNWIFGDGTIAYSPVSRIIKP